MSTSERFVALALQLLVVMGLALIGCRDESTTRRAMSDSSRQNTQSRPPQTADAARRFDPDRRCQETHSEFPYWFPEHCTRTEVAARWAFWAEIAREFPDLPTKLEQLVVSQKLHAEDPEANSPRVVVRLVDDAGTRVVSGQNVDVLVTQLPLDALSELVRVLNVAEEKLQTTHRHVALLQARAAILRNRASTLDLQSPYAPHLPYQFDLPDGAPEHSLPQVPSLNTSDSALEPSPTVVVLGSNARLVVDGAVGRDMHTIKVEIDQPESGLERIHVIATAAKGRSVLDKLLRYRARSGKAGPAPPDVRVIAVGVLEDVRIAGAKGQARQDLKLVARIATMQPDPTTTDALIKARGQGEELVTSETAAELAFAQADTELSLAKIRYQHRVQMAEIAREAAQEVARRAAREVEARETFRPGRMGRPGR